MSGLVLDISSIPHEETILAIQIYTKACVPPNDFPQAAGHGLPGASRQKNPISYCTGGHSLFYFTTFIPVNTVIFDFKMGLFLVFCCRLSPTTLPVLKYVVRVVWPLDFIIGHSRVKISTLREILGYFEKMHEN